MHIALILSQPPGYSETFFKSKIKGLQDAGYLVSLFVQKDDPTFNACRVFKLPKVYKHPIVQALAYLWIILSLVPYVKRVIRFIKLEHGSKRKKTQIFKNIYTNASLLKSNVDWLHFGFATLALQHEHVAKAIEAKMAVSLRGFDIAIYPLKHPFCYERLWLQVDKVHTISNDLLDCAYNDGLSKSTNVEKITPAISTVLFDSSAITKNFSITSTKIITVGRLHWKKGIIDMLEALFILKKKHIDFEYQIIGDGEQKEEILFAIHQLRLEKEVSLLGVKTPKEVKELMDASNIYLQYSQSEGFCNAVLEAQAMGLLCIVSDAEGLSENIIDSKTGWVVPKRQPKLLAKTLESVIAQDDVIKSQFSERAKARVQHQFTLQQQQAKFVEFYKD
ncbi:glycosyltransferase family 4 protein [Winogradskyella helgolandensis]|uniref:glycosyltransferase family 4 protein n=1 Tax=Winogradskyella helgolandensis TaxID=2697010 RepID=UPI0015C6A673|nr:glycosyltransferase family 4 protein [Winogradskyella helgolandensis]